MACGAGSAQADSRNWPAFWRGRFDAQTVTLLDDAFEHYRQQQPEQVLYGQAAVALEGRLQALQPTKSRSELLRRGRAWMFLGELLAGRDGTEAGAAAEAQGLALIESALRPPTVELVETLDSHATTWRLLARPEKAMPLYRRCISVSDQVRAANNKYLIDCLWRLSVLQNNNDQHAEALALVERALPMAEHMYGAASIEVARMLRARGNAYYDLDQPAQALAQYERALAIWDQLGQGDDDSAAYLTRVIGGIHQTLHQYEPALQAFQRQLRIREKLNGPEHPDTAQALDNLGTLYLAMARYADALPVYQRRLAILEKARGPEDAATLSAVNDLVTLYTSMGQYAAALSLARRSLALAEKVHGATDVSTAKNLFLLGGLLMLMGQNRDAVPLLQRCLAIREHLLGPQDREIAAVVAALGKASADLGLYGDALSYMQRAVAIFEQVDGPESLATAVALNNLANLYKLTGQFSAALPLAQRSVAVCEKAAGPEHPVTAQALNNLASIHGAMGRFDLAQPPLLRSATIFVKVLGLEHPTTAAVMTNAGALAYYLGDARAPQILERAVAISEKANGPEHPTTAAALIYLAASYYRLHENDKVLGPLTRAERIAVRSGAAELAWMAQEFLSLQYGAAHRPAIATFWGKQAVNTIQSLRAGIGAQNRDMQQSFLLDKRTVYTGLADLLVTQGRIPEAQAVMQMLKEEEYFDFIRRDATATGVRSTAVPLTGLERQANAGYYQVRDRLSALGAEKDAIQQRQDAGTASPADLQRLERIDADLGLANEAFDNFLAGLDQLLSGNPRTKGQSRQVIDQIKGATNLLVDLQAAGQRAGVLQFIVSQERLHVILTTRSVQIPREVAITPQALNARIQSFREALQNPRLDPRPVGRQLYATLIEPVRADLEAQHIDTLMLVLDDALRYLPFAALAHGDRYLIEDFRLAVYTEASRSRLARQRAPRWQVVALGTTHALPGFEALPAVRAELAGIVQPDVLPGVVRLDEEFTRASLQSALRSPVLHIASHFSFVPGSDQSFLLLGDGEHLTLGDVRQKMRFEVDLLTLSACNTATGGGLRENGSEVEGLGLLAQDKGAAAVLASLWSVADSSTGLLMQQFYRAHRRGLNKAEALRDAQLALLHGTMTAAAEGPDDAARGAVRQDAPAASVAPPFVPNPAAPYAHPFYWAPFVLMGNFL